ncbi:MAG: GNAT family N-acetyltransferase [Chlamydiales bacterium]|nr:GNAT family N-acetyltransferase [Chlamydiales bacterium]
MEELYYLERDDSPKLEAILYAGLNDEAVAGKGMNRVSTFGICIKNETHKILGGAKGALLYGNLYVDSLWIDSKIRHEGWGAKLMAEAEKVGKENGCTFATVNTMDWEALPFYQKLGYNIEFTREGFEKNSKMFMLRKKL